jgi:hypothetical protein
MTVATKELTSERAEDLKLGPCPPFCITSQHFESDRSHGGAGRRVNFTMEPDVEMSHGGIREEGVLINAWQDAGSKACIKIGFATGHKRFMTLDEAMNLAADLLAAVDEAMGAVEGLRHFEDCRVKDHSRDLLSIRRAQIQSVQPDDGEVVDGFLHRFFFCAPCDDWIPLSDKRKTRMEAQLHRARAHRVTA